MGITVNYYLDGTTFANATKIYTDAGLTNLAPNGFYSVGGKYRQQTGGILASENICPACNEGCASSPTSTGEGSFFFNSLPAGIYSIKIHTGTAVGLIRPYIAQLNNEVIGIQVLHNGVLYNDWVNDGGYQSPGGNNPCWIGDGSGTPTPPAAGTSFTNQPVYTWDGTQWVQGGNAGYSVNNPTNYSAATTFNSWCGNVSKTVNNINQQDVDITVFIPPGTPLASFNLVIQCPFLLPAISFNSTVQANPVDACNLSTTPNSFFFGGGASVSTTTVSINGFAYTNQFASSGTLAAGYYKINDGTTNQTMQVDVNGVVIALGTCPP